MKNVEDELPDVQLDDSGDQEKIKKDVTMTKEQVRDLEEDAFNKEQKMEDLANKLREVNEEADAAEELEKLKQEMDEKDERFMRQDVDNSDREEYTEDDEDNQGEDEMMDRIRYITQRLFMNQRMFRSKFCSHSVIN